MRTLAVDIGGSKLQMASFAGRKLIRQERRETDRAGGRAWMMAQIEQIAREWHGEQPFDRVGIGFGGPVDFARQRVVQSTHVGGWDDVDLVGAMRGWLGIPVTMDNDANVGGLGEAAFGAGQGCDPLFYMTLSTGIGGGIVLGGNTVLRGADSYAGEIGHHTLDPRGPQCLCGWHGCFERMCSGLWMERDHGRPMPELLADEEFLGAYVERLAQGLKTALMVLNPARIVIGGGIAKAGDRLLVPLRASLREQMTAWSRARIDVVPAALGDASVLWGCLVLAEERR